MSAATCKWQDLFGPENGYNCTSHACFPSGQSGHLHLWILRPQTRWNVLRTFIISPKVVGLLGSAVGRLWHLDLGNINMKTRKMRCFAKSWNLACSCQSIMSNCQENLPWLPAGYLPRFQLLHHVAILPSVALAPACSKKLNTKKHIEFVSMNFCWPLFIASYMLLEHIQWVVGQLNIQRKK